MLKEGRKGRGCAQADLWRTAPVLCSGHERRSVSVKKERDLRELQASWAAKEALGSRILELRGEGNLRLTQAKAELRSSLLFPSREWRGANKDKSPCHTWPDCVN